MTVPIDATAAATSTAVSLVVADAATAGKTATIATSTAVAVVVVAVATGVATVLTSSLLHQGAPCGHNSVPRQLLVRPTLRPTILSLATYFEGRSRQHYSQEPEGADEVVAIHSGRIGVDVVSW